MSTGRNKQNARIADRRRWQRVLAPEYRGQIIINGNAIWGRTSGASNAFVELVGREMRLVDDRSEGVVLTGRDTE